MSELTGVLAVVNNDRLLVLKDEEPYLYIPDDPFCRGDLYGCRVTDLCPELGGVFVDYGGEKRGFLPTDKAYDQGALLVLMAERPPKGEKGVRFTDRVTLVGRYLIYTPTREYFGYSKKIDRSRPLDSIFPKCHYGILRTKGALASDEALQREAQRLIKEYEALFPLTLGCLKHLTPLEIAVRDYDDILTDASSGEISELKLKYKCEPQVQYAEDVFSTYRTMLKQIDSKKVWLPSGGALIIEETEVATTFDVNTAKCDRRDAKERTNGEALLEIPRQIVLRGISGRVLIDFVDETPEGAQTHFMNRLPGLKAVGQTPSGLLELVVRGA